MSTAMVSMVLDCFPSGGSMCLLAVAMADAADDEGGNIFKSVATLAHQSKQSERTVQRALPMLVDGGWLELVSDGSGGRGRPRVYRIAPAWITRCAMERARARVEGRKPQRVTLGPAADGGGDGAGAHPPALPGPPGVVAGVAVDAGCAQKGVNLSPFMEWQKGDKNSVKGDKNGLKGDSHGCHPNMNIEPNTPLPPVGVGEVLQNPEQPTAPDACGQGPGGPQAGVERCGAPLSVPGVAPKPGPSASPDGLALLLAAYPRQDVADATAASRAYTRLAPSAEDVRTMLAAIELQRQSPDWQREGGRYVPKLSKWLRGWGEGGREVAQRAIALAAAGGAAMVSVAGVVPQAARQPRLEPEQMAANKARVAELAKLVRQGAARGAFASAAGCGVAA